MPASAVVPAYNEETTVGPVVAQLVASPLVDDVIVVSDGSTDGTAGTAAKAGARVLELPENQGKAAAILAGARESRQETLLLLDADLIGLNQEHITALVQPVLTGETVMTIGLFAGGRPFTDWAQRVAPFLSGQRAFSKRILWEVGHLEASHFGLEVLLTRYLEESGLDTRFVPLPYLSHRMKEEKMGLWRGTRARLKMYRDIARYLSFKPSTMD